MIVSLARRLLTEPSPRLVAKFAWNFAFKGMRAVNRFTRSSASGSAFPPFLFISVTNNCNLRCQGCWVTRSEPPAVMPAKTLDRIITEAKAMGSSFFGILGGEPLLYPHLFPVLDGHRDCYFQVLTNGTLLTAESAAEMRRLGNITPLISIEGDEAVSDHRRHGRDVYQRAREGIEHCRRNRLITGVATSVCQSNIADLVSERWLRDLIGAGVHYVWYYIYRPVGPSPCPELTLSSEQIQRLRQFMVDMRTKLPVLIVDAYWDHEGRALCPAAVGISHHINPYGDVEPCPVVQFADTRVEEGQSLPVTLRSSSFLRDFRQLARTQSRGCILMDHPQSLLEFLRARDVRDTTGRDRGLAELAAMVKRPSHDLSGHEIPERHWLYRFAKKHWFFGFGAYG